MEVAETGNSEFGAKRTVKLVQLASGRFNWLEQGSTKFNYTIL